MEKHVEITLDDCFYEEIANLSPAADADADAVECAV